MLARVLPIANTLRMTARRSTILACNMSGYAPAHWKSDKTIDMETLSHMDFLPVPEGSWSEDYKKSQAKYNMQLLFSTVLTVATGIAMYETDCFGAWITPKKL